jgi:hypothetical protein
MGIGNIVKAESENRGLPVLLGELAVFALVIGFSGTWAFGFY